MVQGDVGERCHGILWNTLESPSQEDTMEGSLWKETLGKSLESHDAGEPVGVMCNVQ